MDKITGYFMAPVRGKDGDTVDAAMKLQNVQKAIEIGRSIRGSIASLDLFIPHEHEEIIDMLWRQGTSSIAILDACCAVAVTKQIGILYDGNGVSGGMEREWAALTEAGIEVVIFDTWNEEAREEIVLAMARVENEQI